MAQVGKDRAFSGSGRDNRGISAAEATCGNCEKVEARANPSPMKVATDVVKWVGEF